MKFRLFVDYRGSSSSTITISAKNFREAGKTSEEVIDTFSQEEREEIYCFTLENSSGETLGRFRPHRYDGETIVFAFTFED